MQACDAKLYEEVIELRPSDHGGCFERILEGVDGGSSLIVAHRVLLCGFEVEDGKHMEGCSTVSTQPSLSSAVGDNVSQISTVFFGTSVGINKLKHEHM